MINHDAICQAKNSSETLVNEIGDVNIREYPMLNTPQYGARRCYGHKTLCREKFMPK